MRQCRKRTFAVGRTMDAASEKVNCNHSLLGTVFHGNFSQKEKLKKKKTFSFRHTFPPVLYMEKYQPHGANS